MPPAEGLSIGGGRRDLFTLGPARRNRQHVAVYGANVAQDLDLDPQHSSSPQPLKWDFFSEPKVG